MPIVDQTTAHQPNHNRFLASVPAAEQGSLFIALEHVKLRRGQQLHERGNEYVYFPTSGMVSVNYADPSGRNIPLAQVGCEGVVGVTSLLLGASPGMIGAVVQARGEAYRLRASDAAASLWRWPGFHEQALRYTLAFVLEVAQAAACKVNHSVEQRLCRWLLDWLDRAEGDPIDMTQELIADCLGVRRQGITEAAHRLAKRGIVEHSRGRITVLDRKQLERRACDCYGVLRRETAALTRAAPSAGAAHSSLPTPS